MQKKCVRWAKPVLLFVVAAAALVATTNNRALAQAFDPTTLPRLTFDNLSYVGAFRVPAAVSNGDSFDFGGRQLAFNPSNNSLFMGSRRGRIAEFTIPTAISSSNPAAMPFATYVQGFFDPTEGHLSQIVGEGPALDGLLVHNNRLIGSASIYYDALNAQRVSHYSRSLRLDEPSFSGWSSVWDPAKTGFVSGMMAAIPAEWQSVLGGPAATGQCCIPVVSRTSYGPSAFAFNPAQIANGATAPAAPLLYYPSNHPTLGTWEGQNEVYGSSTFMGGMAIIAGTRTALYLGRNGLGPGCYGSGTANQSLAGTLAADGSHYCYDPADSSKGSHAYPYRYQIWAYDLAGFAAVKAGTKQPWEVVPYAVWPLDLPTPEVSVRLGGVGYDAAHQLLYVSQLYADRDGYAYRPLIHVLQINAAAGGVIAVDTVVTPPVTSPSPAPATSPAPPPSSTNTSGGTITPTSPVSTTTNDASNIVVRSMTLAVNKPSPQIIGTAVTFTAAATGAQGHEYKWLVNAGQGWTALTAWSTANAFTWTAPAVNAKYLVGVWARATGNTADEPEVSASTPFAITEPPMVPVTAVAIGADRPAPQTLGATVTFTANATGGTGPIEYKWLTYDGSSTWQDQTGWTTAKTFTWTPAVARPDYAVRVFARAHGANSDQPQAEAQMAYAINAPAPVLVKSVALTASKTAPQIAGTSVTLTAAATGGVAPLQYKFLLYDGSATWKTLANWSTANAFTWTPSVANADYQVRVLARGGNSTTDAAEAEATASFAITPAAAPIAAVTLGTNKPSPQAAGTTIVASAVVSGGGVGMMYRWLIHDGTSWTPVTDWTMSSTYNWTPIQANPNHYIGVWVRSAASTSNTAEATASIPYPVAPAVSAPINSVTISTDKGSPQAAGTTVVATATVSGGGPGLMFRWLLHDGEQWSIVTDWTASSTYNWTPAKANASHFIGVWVRSAGSTSDTAEATHSIGFVVTPPPAPPITSVTLGTDKVAPQPAGTTIVAKATVSGGGPGMMYRWLLHDGYTWTTLTDWTTSSTYNWTPAQANPNHFLGVWVRGPGSTSDTAEATSSMPFPIK